MSGLPFHIDELPPRRLVAFKSFLANSGAEIFSSSNPYEVVRFSVGGTPATIYRKGNGKLSFYGPVRPAWTAFTGNRPFRAGPKPKRAKGSRRKDLIAALLERDGPGCFYCPAALPPGRETIEHLVSTTAGGPDHLANMALAHKGCNELAGVLSVFEKIRLCERLHADLGATIDAVLAEIADGR